MPREMLAPRNGAFIGRFLWPIGFLLALIVLFLASTQDWQIISFEAGSRRLQTPPLPWLEAYGGTPRPSFFPLQVCQGDCDVDTECSTGLVCFQREANQPVPGCRGGESFFARTDFCIRGDLVEGSDAPSTPNPTFGDAATPNPTFVPSLFPTTSPTTIAPSSVSPPTSSPTDDIPEELPTPPTLQPSQGLPQPTLPPTVTSILTIAPTSVPPAELVGDNGLPSSVFPLQRCQADCDGDYECDWGLYCYRRYDPSDPIPGCDVDPYTIGQIWDKDFCLPSPAILPGAFRLRLYWEEGYVWQDETQEMFWCATNDFNGYPGSGNCWYGEETGPCTSNHTYMARCDGMGLVPAQQAWLFLPVNDEEILIQAAAVYDQRCMERYKREIFLTDCDPNNPLQRWFASNGTSFFDDENKFEISQIDYEKQCITQDHHPKPGEVVELHSCQALRKNSSQTALWTRY